jgi:iron complex transport system substrate-binding protein
VKRLLLLSAAAALLLAGCGASDTEGGDADQAWSYTSGDGKTYTADEVPQRIIAQGDSAAALISLGIRSSPT